MLLTQLNSIKCNSIQKNRHSWKRFNLVWFYKSVIYTNYVWGNRLYYHVGWFPHNQLFLQQVFFWNMGPKYLCFIKLKLQLWFFNVEEMWDSNSQNKKLGLIQWCLKNQNFNLFYSYNWRKYISAQIDVFFFRLPSYCTVYHLRHAFS